MGELVPFSPRSTDPAPSGRTGSPFLTLFCAGCGADRTVPPSAADPGPCPKCGSTLRTSCRPGENGYPAGAGAVGPNLGHATGPWYGSSGGAA